MVFMLAIFIIIPGVIFAAIFLALFLYFIRNFKYWQKLGIPYVKPTPFVGNLKDCAFQRMSIGRKYQQIYNEHSDKPYVGIFSFDQPSLLIRDRELVKSILVKDSHNVFADHFITFNEELEPIFARGLPFLKGQRWRHVRTNLSPVFTSRKMKKIFYLMDTFGKELVECLDRATLGGCTVDVKDMMYRYTTDVIASCAFGINGNSLKDPQAEFRHYTRKILAAPIQKGLTMLTAYCAPRLTTLLKLKFFDDDTNHFMRKTVWSTVEYREKNGFVLNDVLDSLMELRNMEMKECSENVLSAKNETTDVTFKIDGDNFVAQALTFISAGVETSGITMSYALYEIALHPEIQIRLRAEILQVLNRHSGQLTYDGIQEMAYLDMVVSETLRKYPVVPFVDRINSSDYEMPAPSGNGTITLPAGTGVYVSVLALHNDPAYFPEPEKFDPERFTDENKHSRPNYTYLPFGEGPRICLGMRFGLMQIKTGLCYILSHFEVTPCKDTPVPIVFDPKAYFLVMKGELPLSFERTHQ